MRNELYGTALLALSIAASGVAAHAEDAVKIGVVLPLSGPFSPAGVEIANGIKTYLKVHGSEAGGRRLEVIIRDDGGIADASKRISQELLTNEHVAVLAGYGLTPLAISAAPLATQARVPQVLMSAATGDLTTKSPYTVRVFETMAQVAYGMSSWAGKNSLRKVVTMVADYGPGIDAEQAFKKGFEKVGGTVVESIRVPLNAMDFGPYLQRASDSRPDAIYVFEPEGPAAILIRQYNERGLAKAGIRFIGSGDFLDEETIDAGNAAFAAGILTSQVYTATHTSPENDSFVAAYKGVSGGTRPNVMGTSGYDGMYLIAHALERTGGKTDGPALVEAMKGTAWKSPRGDIHIDPATRDIVQNVYVREVKASADGRVDNVEVATIPAVRPDPYAAVPQN